MNAIKSFFKKSPWSPFLIGAMIGLLLTSQFIMGYEIGVSSGIARIVALIEKMILPSHVENTPYFKTLLSDSVIFNWKVLFVIGLYIGSKWASKISSPYKEESTQAKNNVKSHSKRNALAFLGGFLLLMGARIADGCTSGHAITGGAQLSVTSWMFMIALFTVAIPVSSMLYKNN